MQAVDVGIGDVAENRRQVLRGSFERKRMVRAR
jgi:hypothetical protein